MVLRQCRQGAQGTLLYCRTYIMHKPGVKYKSCSYEAVGSQEAPFDDGGELKGAPECVSVVFIIQGLLPWTGGWLELQSQVGLLWP